MILRPTSRIHKGVGIHSIAYTLLQIKLKGNIHMSDVAIRHYMKAFIEEFPNVVGNSSKDLILKAGNRVYINSKHNNYEELLLALQGLDFNELVFRK